MANEELIHYELTGKILHCCFEVLNHLLLVSYYITHLIVEKAVIIELKCCKTLLPEHQAQVINYLKATGIPVGLLINFGKRSLEYKRIHHPYYPVGAADLDARQGDPLYPVPFFNPL